MSRIVFGIKRDVPWHRSNRPVLRYWLGDTLKKALSDACFTSLEIDGQAIGKERAEWGKGLTSSALLSFLERFRNQPGSTNPDSSVREGLHSFLFPKNSFDAQLGAALARDVIASRRSVILIRGDSGSLPLIVNVPWELADGVPTDVPHPNQALPLFGTLASLGLARIIAGTSTRLNLTAERLRVLYCISQPQGLTPIGASAFHEAITQSLKDRQGKLSYRSVTNGDFMPTFNQLKVAIEEIRPHILIIVCHGQTMDGVPQLRFENWYTVASLADSLYVTDKTFLVILIACDQTRLDEHPTAHSGAVTLLERGILSVIAMQSSVDAILAREFLGTTLDWFLESGEIALSVAQGRKSMAPTAVAGDYVDWSFPALFLTEDAHLHTDKFEQIINSYFPALDEMLRRIPRPHFYLERPSSIDQPLQQFFRVEEVGLKEIIGGKGTGKTTALLYASRRVLERAQEMHDTSARPLLYVDFSRYAEEPKTVRELAEILRKQTEEIHSSVVGSPLLEWATPRGADGEGRADDQIRQLLRLIDLNRMVLVLDNISEADKALWQEFFEGANNLNNSLIIRAAETASQASADHVQVLPLSKDETREYVRSFAPQRVADADVWFDKTAGLPGFLDLMRRVDIEGDDINLMVPPGFTSNLSQSEREILYTLANLPNGVDPELASAYTSARWRDLLRLEQRGLLLRESRFNIDSAWFRLPQMLMQSLLSDEEPVAEAARSLVERFIEHVTDDEDNKIEENCINLASKPGGIDFLQDIHRVFLDTEYQALAHALPLLLHKWLFSHGRWYDAYRLWERLLTKSSINETQAHEWIKLAKAAHILGMGSRAEEFVRKAEALGLTALDEIDVLILRAALIKDSGEMERAAEVTALYDQILNRISTSVSALQVDSSDRAELEERQALTIYNRALHRRYWLRDLPGALSDLEQAGAEFGRLGIAQMQALADCEWVDIQLNWQEHLKNWPEMLDRLVNANAVFASSDGSLGDSAFCYYQLARYYRRKPFGTEAEARENITKARDAYQKASEKAQLAGDMRQRAIADGHLVEVRWRDLGEIDVIEATKRLDTVIDLLKTFPGDDWSTNVLRDMLLLRAHTMRVRGPDEVLAAYQEAWAVARRSPLRPMEGTDARRAARILFEYLKELESADRMLEVVEVSVNAHNLIEHWLGHIVDSEKYRGWIDEIGQFSVGPGEYYGQPKR